MRFLQNPYIKQSSQLLWHKFYSGQKEKYLLLYPQTPIQCYASENLIQSIQPYPAYTLTFAHFSLCSNALVSHIKPLAPQQYKFYPYIAIYAGISLGKFSIFEENWLQMHRASRIQRDQDFVDFMDDLLLKSDTLLSEMIGEFQELEWVMASTSCKLHDMTLSLQNLRKSLKGIKRKWKAWSKKLTYTISAQDLRSFLYEGTYTLGAGTITKAYIENSEITYIPYNMWSKFSYPKKQHCANNEEAADHLHSFLLKLKHECHNISAQSLQDYENIVRIWKQELCALTANTLSKAKVICHSAHPYMNFALLSFCNIDSIDLAYYQRLELKRLLLGYDIWADYLTLQTNTRLQSSSMIHAHFCNNGDIEFAYIPKQQQN